MDEQRLKILYKKHCNNALTAEEFEEFHQALEDIDAQSLLSLYADSGQDNAADSFAKEDVFNRISSKIDDLEKQKEFSIKKSNKVLYYRVAAAVAVFFIFSYFILNHIAHDSSIESNKSALESLSNDNTKTLASNSSNIQFADGRTLDLDLLPDDSISHRGISIVRVAENELTIHNETGSADFDLNSFHMFAAKKGSTLKLTLPDKSTVQLNSGSSINISSSYGIKDRNVLLKGEGFFEVAHNKQTPFIVEVKDAKINVLGTVFNLSAYDQDKEVQATLISGSIAVNTSIDQTVIKPGQKATVGARSAIRVDSNVDLNQILAWREGIFRFQDQSIESILNELSKWYYIEDVQVATNLKDKFTGSIKRTKQLKDVLTAIQEVSDLHFELQEGRVKVMK
ncbi:FecR family protein [Sphingobacterium cavernae]|uniref:FecR family protein n=1 Tax=Sphingobacterium cavernae TaxID=2592657 RepID=UPI00123008D1|nr:FecR family protein [Sphingobacterium cavernae]